MGGESREHGEHEPTSRGDGIKFLGHALDGLISNASRSMSSTSGWKTRLKLIESSCHIEFRSAPFDRIEASAGKTKIHCECLPDTPQRDLLGGRLIVW
jgi:hypothetical protein